MIKYNKEVFEEFYDANSGELFENIEFNRCKFNYCNISQTKIPVKRTTVRNVNINNCVITRGSVGCAVLENIRIHNVRNNGLIQIKGAVFKHVILKGKIGSIMITNEMYDPDEQVQEAFFKENEHYYSNVDWAIDISEAECVEIDIRGIPSELIRINPETQGIIRRENIPTNWKEIDFHDRVTSVVLDNLIHFGFKDGIYVAPKSDKKHFENMLKDLEMMRELGIVDPI